MYGTLYHKIECFYPLVTVSVLWLFLAGFSGQTHLHLAQLSHGINMSSDIRSLSVRPPIANGHLLKLFNDFNTMMNFGCHGNQKANF